MDETQFEPPPAYLQGMRAGMRRAEIEGEKEREAARLKKYPRKLDIGTLTVEEAEKDYPVVWQTAAYSLPKLSKKDLATVVAIAMSICPYCYEANRGCQCWNDE